MAGKRVSVSAINWAAFAERVPKSEYSNFQTLKAKNDAYVRRVAAFPDTLPKIDWNFYRSRITVPGMVDSFQKEYEGLKIPYPSDKGLIAKINEQEADMKKKFAEFVVEADSKIEQFRTKLAVLEAQIPVSEMTIEEYCLAFPDQVFNHEKPIFFPHDEEAAEATKKAIEGRLY